MIVIRIIIFIIFLSTSIFSQKYYFKKYTTADGLIQGTVKEIYQDSKGRMWFGTVEGLSIYDGQEFYNYGRESGIRFPVISSFFELPNGLMLVGTYGDGIKVFRKAPNKKDEIFASITDSKYIVNLKVNKIERDLQNNILILTENGFTKWIINDDSLASIQHEKYFNGLGPIEVYDAVFLSDSLTYYATNKGLMKNSKNKYEIIFPNSKQKEEAIFFLFKDCTNSIWFTTTSKFYKLSNDEIKEVIIPNKTPDHHANAMVENSEGEQFIGGLSSLIKIVNGQVYVIDNKNGFEERTVISLYLDNDDNLWIGSLEGLSKLSQSNFRFISSDDIELNFPRLIKSGDKLLVSNSRSVYRIENYSLHKYRELNYGSSIRILDYKEFDGEEWYATDIGVVIKSKLKMQSVNEANGLPHEFVYSIEKDREGIIWLLTQGGVAYIKNGILYNFKDRLEKEWNYSDNQCQKILSSMSIRNIVIDSSNCKWISSWQGGLFKICGNIILRFTAKDGLYDLRVRSLCLDKLDQVWIGTRFSGVFKYDGQKFKNYDKNDGLISNWVLSISNDSDGNYWFGTSNGISKFDGSKWVNYDARDGIISGEIIIAQEFDNLMWFNSWDQIFYYKPYASIQKSNPPIVYFTEIRSLNEEHESINPMLFNNNTSPKVLFKMFNNIEESEIDYEENSISISFSATNFRNTGQVKYDYKLEGFDKQWIKGTKRNYITYTHLPAGEYRFLVNAYNREGVKSLTPAEYKFYILPPFWQRWWFILASFLFLVFIISSVSIFIYRIKVNNLLRIERLRLSIASDLHDEVGSGLSGISIYTQLAKREASSNNPNVISTMDTIGNDALMLIEKMSDIVWAINPDNDTLEDAIIKFQDYAAMLLEAKGIQLKMLFSDDAKSINLTLEKRRCLLLIFKEIINNTLKHSKATEVFVKLLIENVPDTNKKILKLIVKDNGKGFDNSIEHKGNGIKNIKRRTESIGGTSVILSENGKGTEYNVSIPL